MITMEWHIQCDPEEISRYVFCPGDQARAKKIVDHMDDARLVADRPVHDRLRHGHGRANDGHCPGGAGTYGN
jgi:uridine phosphorylase